MLNFTSFNTEANADYLRLYNGNSLTAPLLATLSGNNLPSPVISNGTSLTMSFLSNSAITFPGFTLQETFIAAPCTGPAVFTTNNSIVSDGAAPYTSFMNCTWTITAPADYRVVLTFTSFDTEQGVDVLTVFDGSANTPVPIASFSGQALPAAQRTIGSRMFITWTTDGVNNYDGFRAIATFEPIPNCMASPSPPITLSGTTITEGYGNYGSQMACVWNITAPLGYRVALSFLTFETEPNVDVLTIYEGPNTTANNWNLRTRLSGTSIPAAQYSTGSNMILTFTTDANVFAAGFSALVTFVPIPACSGQTTITFSGATISSGTGVTTTAGSNCSWVFLAPPGAKISLDFLALNTVADANQVSLFDNSTQAPVLMGRFSGSVVPATQRAALDAMFVTWTPTANSASDVFYAVVTFNVLQIAPCQGLTTVTTNGFVLSDGTGPYAANSACSWSIQAPPGYLVALFIRAFSVTLPDSLNVYDGNSTSSPVLAQIAGSAPPPRAHLE